MQSRDLHDTVIWQVSTELGSHCPSALLEPWSRSSSQNVCYSHTSLKRDVES